MIRSVPLRRVRFGHDHPAGMNCRIVGRDDGLNTMAATILADGVLYPLLGFEDNPTGSFEVYVYDGNRRLAGLNLLAERGEIDPDSYEVDVDISGEEPAILFARSIIANIERAPLHPVDRFEAFARLEAAGHSHQQIAHRFGIASRDVQKAMALGNLAPTVREAWRSGDIDDDAARAFTLNPDHEAQAAVFDQLAARASLTSWQVKAAVQGNAEEFVAEIEFVGLQTYRDAGGRTVEDLFGDKILISDPQVLHGLVREQMAQTIQGLRDDGWAWAGWDVDVGRAYNLPKIELPEELTPEEDAAMLELKAQMNGSAWAEAQQRMAAIKQGARLRAFTPDHMEASGVVIELSRRGSLVFHYGHQRPDQVAAAAPPKAAQAPADGGEAPATIKDPKPLLDMVRSWRTGALKGAVLANPIGAVLMLTAFLRGGPRNGAPLGLAAALGTHPGGGTFVERAGQLADLTTETGALSELAHALIPYVVATTEAAEGYHGVGVRDEAVAAAAELLGAEVFDRLARQVFDPVAYFREAKKAHAVQAARECFGDDKAAELEKMKAGAAAAWAADNCGPHGWLPPLLRSSDYRLVFDDTPKEGRAETTKARRGRGKARE
jgi:ParB family chromosome partitioning protein